MSKPGKKKSPGQIAAMKRRAGKVAAMNINNIPHHGIKKEIRRDWVDGKGVYQR